MAKITVNQHAYRADLLVFDKDGLMFDSEQFWIEMANARMRSISKHCTPDDLLAWAKLMGVRTEFKHGGVIEATFVDPTGILAVAPPAEEIVILAGFLVQHCNLLWHKARNLAAAIFTESDAGIDLSRALAPQPGFVNLMKRINELDVPYGVATSDTYDRTRDSMSRYGCWDKVRFVITPEEVERGKPNPDMLLFISDKTGVPIDRIAMIGDSYVDVAMAQAAGSVGIGVTVSPEMREKMIPHATEIVNTLDEIRVDR